MSASRCSGGRAWPSRRRRRCSSTYSAVPATGRTRMSGSGTASVPTCWRWWAVFSARSAPTRPFAEYAQRARLRVAGRDAGRRRTGALRRNPACGRDRRRLGAGHGGLRGQGGPLSVDEVMDDPRRGLAGHRLQPRAGAEVAGARGRHGRAARRQRAAEGARPPEGRFRLDRHPRTAHAAHLDPRVFRDPARRSRTSPPPSGSSSSASSSRRASG